MRFQVRVGEQYQELLEHLEGFKPEYRGKRLLALAAMQLSSVSFKNTNSLGVVETPASESEEASHTAAENTPAGPPKRRSAPNWIKSNTNA
ncbi:MAG: hypothetical protein R3260_00290 [Pseudomonas sp.]|nr:hypothetical protein [Pseudomonas sp.]